jgi:glycosyltransferase involved in cell wall biosynthesis
MRIALFHNAPSGGAKRAIYEWTRRLAKNHAIDVYTLSTADHEFCDIRPYVAGYNISEFESNRLYESPFGRLNQLQRRRDLEKLTELSERIAKTIEIGRYDVFFAHTCQFTVIPTVLQFLETPSVYYLHEPFGQAFTRQISRPYVEQGRMRATLDRYDPLIKRYQQKLDAIQQDSVSRTSLLLANSRFTQKQMKRIFGVDTPVCHYGVNLDSFRPLSGVDKESFVVSVGELSPRKGFDFVVESVGRIPSDRRPQLKLACNRIELAELMYIQDLAEHCGVDLEVKSSLNSHDLAVLLNQAYLCAYAPVQEPFGLVPLEAMACGTPVVGVNEGGVKESVVHEQTGLLVDRNQDQFADALEQLILQPQLAKAYGQSGRKYVRQNWTWAQSTTKLEQHLEACTVVGKSSYDKLHESSARFESSNIS